MACSLQVAHEWLATGRGGMALVGPRQAGATERPEQADDPFEARLLQAWRRLPAKPRIAVLELVEAYRSR